MLKKRVSMVIFTLSVLFTGCSGNAETGSNNSLADSERENTEAQAVESHTQSVPESETVSPSDDLVFQLGETFLPYTFVQSGTLNVTVNSAAYYTNLNDIGVSYDDLVSGQEFVNQSSGDLLDDEVFVLGHITMENVDAVSTAITLSEPSDAMQYREHDFRADFFVPVIEDYAMVDINSGVGNYYLSDNAYSLPISYFSLSGELEIHPLAFTLSPGETKEFEIGFICFTKPEEGYGKGLPEEVAAIHKEKVDLSKLAIGISMNKKDSIVELGLE